MKIKIKNYKCWLGDECFSFNASNDFRNQDWEDLTDSILDSNMSMQISIDLIESEKVTSKDENGSMVSDLVPILMSRIDENLTAIEFIMSRR